MDPLSMTAAILTLLSALDELRKLVTQLKEAPRNCVLLKTEIAALQSILDDLSAMPKSPSNDLLAGQAKPIIVACTVLCKDLVAYTHKVTKHSIDSNGIQNSSFRDSAQRYLSAGTIADGHQQLVAWRENLLTLVTYSTHQNTRETKLLVEGIAAKPSITSGHQYRDSMSHPGSSMLIGDTNGGPFRPHTVERHIARGGRIMLGNTDATGIKTFFGEEESVGDREEVVGETSLRLQAFLDQEEANFLVVHRPMLRLFYNPGQRLTGL